MRKSLSLLELLVAVSILAIGIAYVLRSFWSALTAIETVESRVAAVQALDAALNRIETELLAGEYPVAGSRTQELDLGSRPAVYREDIEEFVPDWLPEDGEDEETAAAVPDPTFRLVRVISSLTWQEGGRQRSQAMSLIAAVPVEEDE